METMTTDEYRRFCRFGTRTGKLATVRSDGAPHVVPIWFQLDTDGTIVFTTGDRTVKAQNMHRDPRVSLCVDDDRPPFSYVHVMGRAEMAEAPDELLHWATKIAARYMGDELAESYGRRNAVKGELLVRVTVSKVIALRGVAD